MTPFFTPIFLHQFFFAPIFYTNFFANLPFFLNQKFMCKKIGVKKSKNFVVKNWYKKISPFFTRREKNFHKFVEIG